MRRNMTCLRCGTAMEFLKVERLQLGKASFLMGELPNLLAGALEVEIYICPGCRKMEFFGTDGEETSPSGIAQKTCPKCGLSHDMDDPKCPRCRYRYEW